MQIKYYKFLDEVLGNLSELEQYHALHLTSIAKSIELHNPKINKIVFQELSGKGLNLSGPGILLTQELEMVGYDSKDMVTYDHFIFYETEGLSEMAVRFTIAHELGHIFFNNPMDVSMDERVYVPVPDSENLFAVHYRPDHEIMADFFALIMCEQRQAILRFPYRHPCFVFVKNCIKSKLTTKTFRDAFEKRIKDCEEYARAKSL